MAIRATDPFVIHLALYERTIHIDFVFDLAVSKVRIITKQLKIVKIAKLIAPMKAFRQDPAATVAGGTGLQLRLRILTFQLCQTVSVPTIPEQRFAVCEFKMQTAWAVTRFTTDVNF